MLFQNICNDILHDTNRDVGRISAVIWALGVRESGSFAFGVTLSEISVIVWELGSRLHTPPPEAYISRDTCEEHSKVPTT
jgi:hypothetical protein